MFYSLNYAKGFVEQTAAKTGVKRPVCSRGVIEYIKQTPRRWMLKKQEIFRGVVREIMNGFDRWWNRS